MPRKKKSMKDQRQGHIDRGYKQYGKRYWKNEQYFPRTATGRVPTLRTRTGQPSRTQQGLTMRQYAETAHYKDFLSRPQMPKNPTGRLWSGSNTKMGPLGPDLVLFIAVDPLVIGTMRGDRKGRIVLDDLEREMRVMLRRITAHMKKRIGDPRPFGSGDGLLPRGGTGKMRLLSRAALDSQLVNERHFPFQLDFEIPVEYANPLNQAYMSYRVNRLAHTNEMGWRIVDYTPSGTGSLKARYGYVRLNDPQARGGFFERLIRDAWEFAGQEMQRLILKLKYKYRTLDLLDIDGHKIVIDESFFEIEPKPFVVEVYKAPQIQQMQFT